MNATPNPELRRVLVGLSVLCVCISGCQTPSPLIPAVPMPFQLKMPYSSEVYADEPIGYWRLDGPIKGAISGDLDGAMAFDGNTHRQLGVPELGGVGLTVEFWAAGLTEGTVLSYATEAQPDAFILSCSSQKLAVTLVGERVETGLSLCRGEAGWAHVAVSWSGDDGRVRVALDGREVWQGEVASAVLPRGGVVVVGQRQGCVGGCLREGLVGGLDEVAIHERALHASRLLSHTLVGRGERHPTPANVALPEQIQPQTPHANDISALTFSPDGRFLATGDEEGLIKLWDVTTGRLMRNLNLHSDWIKALRFTPDGRLLISSSEDNTVRVWEVVTGESLHRLSGHNGAVFGLQLTPEGLVLVTASDDESVRVWDLKSGRQLRSFAAEGQKAIYTAKLSPDGTIVATGGEKPQLWDLSSGEPRHALVGHKDVVNDVSFSPDGRLIATVSDDGSAAVWEIASGDRVQAFPLWVDKGAEGEPLYALEVHFLGDSRRILVCLEDGQGAILEMGSAAPVASLRCGLEDDQTTAMFPGRGAFAVYRHGEPIEVWDMGTGALRRTIGRADKGRGMVAVGPEGRFLAGVNEHNTLRVWDLNSDKPATTLSHSDSDATITRAVFSPDGRQIASNGWGRIWDAETGRQLHSILGKYDEIEYHPSGRVLALGSIIGDLVLVDPLSGETLSRRRKAHKSIEEIVFSPDGSMLATHGGSDKTAVVWSLEGRAQHRFAHETSVRALAFSPSGHALITATNKGAVVWDVASGRQLQTFEKHNDFVNDILVFEGDVVLTSGDDGFVRAWSLKTGDELYSLSGHVSFVGKMLWAESVNHLVSAGFDLTLAWDLGSREVLRSLKGHEDDLIDMALSPLGDKVLTASHDRTLRLWDSFGHLEKTFDLDTIALSVSFSPDGRRIAAACDDGVIRVLNLDKASTVMMVGGVGWLTFTEDNYFDASPDGAALVAMVQGDRIFGIDQIALKRNRPDILIERLGLDSFDPLNLGQGSSREAYFARMAALGHDREAMAMRRVELGVLKAHFKARAERRQEKAGVAPGEAPPVSLGRPQARILQTHAERGNLEMALSFHAAEGLASHQIYVNDVPVFATPRPLSGQRAHISAQVELGAGHNKIEVTARDVHGTESRRALTSIEYEGERLGSLYFLGFGVSDYQHNDQIPDLQYAHQDALDLAAYFKEATEGYEAVHVHTFTDAQVTPEAIRSASSLIDGATVHDTFILFVAGHGVRDEDAAHTYYYLTHGARLDDLSGTAIRFEAIEALLYDSKPRQKLFLMDTCQSGEIDEDLGEASTEGEANSRGLKARAVPMGKRSAKAFGAAPTTKSILTGLDRERFIYTDLTRRSGAIVLSSSRGQEYSLEGPQFENGAFTEEILKALHSDVADADSDRRISTDELREYVIDAVPDLTDDRQHPTVDRDNIHQKFTLPILAPRE